MNHQVQTPDNQTCDGNIKLGLANVKYALELLGHPDNSFFAIHIAGTNGKGSTCTFLERFYIDHTKFKIAKYSSPHLLSVTERFRVDGKEISREYFNKYYDFLFKDPESPLFVNDLVTKLTEFEKLTVLAFRYFADEDVDIAIIETGLGGRLDATNALNPAHSLATAITNIGYDHMDYLGNTLKDIRREKEGIKKPTVPHFELTERNQGVNPNSIAGDNCKLAVKIFESINKITLSDDYLHETCKNFHAYMPCRLQYDLRSHTLWDAAHNVDGFRLLHTHVKELKFRGKFNRLIIVCGFLDKNYQQMLEVFLSDLYKPVSDYIIVSGIDSKRVTDPHKIKEHLHKTYPETKKNHRVFALKSADKAFEKAKSLKQDHDLIIFCGSNYLLGELKTYERSLKKLKSAKV